MSTTITIKPHHYLDIIKLHGAGLDKFVPDLAYGHDFYRVGNIILDDPDVLMRLTRGADDICTPCKHIKDGKCADNTDANSLTASKEEWNQAIDQRIMELLDIQEGSQMTSKEFCTLASSRINAQTIVGIWKEQPQEITKRRTELLLEGIRKYLKR